MRGNLRLIAVLVLAGALASSLPVQSVHSDTGFTNVRKATGVIMKFCENHATTLHECVEKYDGYTWTDRINVLIWAPGWNLDSDKLDRIGDAMGSPITVSSRNASVDTAIFTETGPDTGLFFGVVKLTGQHFTVHDQNGSLVVGHGHTSSNYGQVSAPGCVSTSAGGHSHGGGGGHGGSTGHGAGDGHGGNGHTGGNTGGHGGGDDAGGHGGGSGSSSGGHNNNGDGSSSGGHNNNGDGSSSGGHNNNGDGSSSGGDHNAGSGGHGAGSGSSSGGDHDAGSGGHDNNGGSTGHDQSGGHGAGGDKPAGHTPAHGFLIPLVKLQNLLLTAFLAGPVPQAHAQTHAPDELPPCGSDVVESSFDVAARLATDLQDGAVTVSWEANEDIVLTKTATWEWRVGELSFERDSYSAHEPISFTLHDSDLWIHHAEFFTYWMRVYSDSDQAGIYVPVSFIPNHDHGTPIEYEGLPQKLTKPAASSLTKYTPDGKYKVYFWWQPGGVIGVGQEYDLNLMVHDGRTDIHQTKLGYSLDIYHNGQLVDSRPDRFSGDGHAIEPVSFAERGSVKVVVRDIFGTDAEQDFSFQVAPEPVIEKLAPRHPTFDVPLDEYAGHYGAHYIDVLEGEFHVTLHDDSSDVDRLKVSNGDTITVEYVDLTLPEPYTSRDSLDVQASTLVFDLPPVRAAGGDADDGGAEITEISAGQRSGEGIRRIQAGQAVAPVPADISIPVWIKKSASWWSGGQMSDPEFAAGLEYLVREGIVDVRDAHLLVDDTDPASITSIPQWVRSSASWWSEGQLSDVDFANGIKYLIATGVIQI